MALRGFQATGVLVDLFDQAELVEWLTEAKANLRSGNTRVVEWSSGDSSAKKVLDSFSTLEAITEIRFALADLDPDNYGQKDVPTHTNATFV